MSLVSEQRQNRAIGALALLCITNVGWLGMLASCGIGVLAAKHLSPSFNERVYWTVALTGLAITWGVLYRYLANEEVSDSR